MGRRKTIVLTPEQQRFAEIHYGLLLKFMAIHHLGDDEYGLFAERYLRTVATYMERKSLHSRYAFSTIGPGAKASAAQACRDTHE